MSDPLNLEAAVVDFKRGFDVEAEKANLLKEASRIKESLDFITNFESSVDLFVDRLKAAFGDSLTPNILYHNLQTRFGTGNASERHDKQNPRAKKSPNESIEIYNKVLSVLTREPMSFIEIMRFMEDGLPRSQVNSALKQAIDQGLVDTSGKYKGKRYFLTANAPS